MNWEIIYSKDALKDAKKLSSCGLVSKAQTLLAVIQQNPWQTPPPYEKLTGNLSGYCSRRINIQHRLLYIVNEASRTIRIQRMWTHYE